MSARTTAIGQAVIDAIKPALIKNGLYFTQRPQPSEGGVTIETVIARLLDNVAPPTDRVA